MAAVQSCRIRVLKKKGTALSCGEAVVLVVYWIFRDQRLKDNWTLIHAIDQANKANVPVAVAFNLFDQFLGANAHQLGFMLRGLQQLHHEIEETLHISFFLFEGWRELPVFGKIRYMNHAGCKRKFDVDEYISYVKRLVGKIKKRKIETLLNNKAKELGTGIF